MALDHTKWEIQNDKDIRYIGPAHTLTGANYVTTIELHRWLGGLADDASQANSDDFLDITRDTPSDRSTDNIITLLNGYNIDDATAEYIYGGSIIQAGGATIYDGILVYANPDLHMELIQNGANIANDFWNSIQFNDGGINPNGYRGLNRDQANGIAMRFMVKIRSGGTDIDGTRLIGHTREWGKTYSEFRVNGTSRGNNVIALTYANDLNNDETIGNMVSAPYTNVVNDSAAYNLMDVDDDSVNEAYYSRWDLNGAAINDLYQRMKYLSRRGETATLYGIQGQIFRGITHDITVDNPSTPTNFEPFEQLNWTGGTGQMLAINNVDAPTRLWIQLLTGVAPTDGQTLTGQTSGATCDVNVTVTERTLSFPFCGQSTGSALLGAYGFGVDELDLAATDSVVDLLTGDPITPPNNVIFTVGNLVSGDEVLVAERGYRFNYDGGTTGWTVGETLTFSSPAGTAKLNKIIDNGTTGEIWIGPMLTGTVPTNNSTVDGATGNGDVNGDVVNDVNLRQLTNNALLNGVTTSVVTATAIPLDTPATGWIRILRANGAYSRHPYSAWTGSTFTITSHDFTSNNAIAGANIFIGYIDDASAGATMSFTSVFQSERAMFFRVRNAALIKTSEGTGTLGSAGGSANASRISDY